MVKPTPWGRTAGAEPAGEVHTPSASTPSSTATGGQATGSLRDERWDRRRALAAAALRRTRDRAEEIRTTPRLSGKWGYVFSALGFVVTFILMFQHWMVAHGPDGMAAATPFGQVDSTTKYLTVWSSEGPPPAANFTGSWAVTASSVIAVTIAAVAIHIVTGSPRFARIATGASVLSALLVLANLLYLTSQQKSLKNMTIRRWDLGGQIGSWINWAFNDGSKPVAGLNQVDYVASGTITSAAIAAVVIAVGAAVIAVATMPRRTDGSGSTWTPWRISVSRGTTSNYVATTGTDRPAADATGAGPATRPPDATATGSEATESRTEATDPPDDSEPPGTGPAQR
ncbi:hypothetical protein [Nocardia sp. NPDC019395]|uniref:hypothetical protein n=1 Tax=Nocardia sp. NPDC019395 TaxID=3154686 RepID=UPI00340E0A6B